MFRSTMSCTASLHEGIERRERALAKIFISLIVRLIVIVRGDVWLLGWPFARGPPTGGRMARAFRAAGSSEWGSAGRRSPPRRRRRRRDPPDLVSSAGSSRRSWPVGLAFFGSVPRPANSAAQVPVRAGDSSSAASSRRLRCRPRPLPSGSRTRTFLRWRRGFTLASNFRGGFRQSSQTSLRSSRLRRENCRAAVRRRGSG